VCSSDLIAYGEIYSEPGYYLSSVADEVYLNPQGMLELNGLASEMVFLKGFFEKIEVDPIIFRVGDFKSAVEPFFLSKMSDSSRLQMQVILQDLWTQNRNDISATRQLDTTTIDSLVNCLAVRNLNQAAQHKLLDQTMYRGEVLALLKKKVGIDENTPLRLQAFAKYARDTFHDNQLLARQERHIAVILAEGDVEAEGDQISTERMTKLLRQVRDNNDVKAVVLRINSPGGSALASEEIWKEVSLTAAKKTLYVSMGDYAASGGYYIATPAAKIFANPMTITGSIGVFGVVPFAGDFFDHKLGVTTDEVRTHRYGGLSLTKKLSTEELNLMQEEIDAIYFQFIERVSEGRQMTKNETQRVARGRVWTGMTAKQCGLVDELGGLNTAIQAIRKKVGVSEVVYYPQQENDTFSNFWAMLAEELEGEKSRATVQIPQELLLYYQKYAQIKKIKGLQMRLPFSFSIH
jgi:protease-4